MVSVSGLITLAIPFFIFSIGNASANDGFISKEDALNKINAGALLVDVRTPEEYKTHIEGAINIPHDQVEERLQEFGENKDRVIVVYCKSGGRSGRAQAILKEAGFKNVFNAGGYSDLK